MNQTARDSTPVKLGNKFIVENSKIAAKSLKKGGSSSLEKIVFENEKASPVKLPTMGRPSNIQPGVRNTNNFLQPPQHP